MSPRWWRGAVGIAVALAIVEAITRAGLVTSEYLPPATSILARAAELLSRGSFLGDLWTTLKASLLGLGLATLGAVPLGLVLGLGPLAYRAAIVVIEFLRPIPSVALIPLAILVYGRGTSMKVALVVYACAWPLLFNTIYGMRAVDQVAADSARVFGLPRRAVARRVYLPSASPFVFAGFKIAASIAIILAVSAELLAGGSGGIGITMLNAASVGDQRTVYAVTVITGLLGLVLLGVLGLVERRVFAWTRHDGREA